MILNTTKKLCGKAMNQVREAPEKIERNSARKSVNCIWCGKQFYRYNSAIKNHNFCCNEHRMLWWRKYTLEFVNVKGHGKGTKRPHLSLLNKARIGNKNPMSRPEVRKKVGDAQRNRGAGKSYRKLNNRHEHRIVAEQKIGRPLGKDEVVHHIDRNKRNNSPDNLMVCTRSEHARIHFSKKAGDANENIQK